MFDPGPCVYMDKIAVGPEAADVIDIDAPVKANLEAVAKAQGEDVDDITAVILDRPRHEDIIRECREAGARIRLIQDGDVAGAITVAAPEQRHRHPLRHRRHARRRDRGLRAQVHRRRDVRPALAPQRRGAQAALDAGYDLDRVLTTDDLVSGDDVFFARHRHHRRRPAQGRALLGRRREHAVAGDALEVGHHPHHRRHPQVAEAHALLGAQVRLIRTPAIISSTASV